MYQKKLRLFRPEVNNSIQEKNIQTSAGSVIMESAVLSMIHSEGYSGS